MKPFSSCLDQDSDQFDQNRTDMLGLVDQLRAVEMQAVERSVQNHGLVHGQNKLLARERLSHLLDAGLPFLQLYNLCAYNDDDIDAPMLGGSIIAGIGFVAGVRCMIMIDDGAINQGDVALGLLAIALKQKLPLIHLMEPLHTQLTSNSIEHWARGGQLLTGFGKLSAAGIPTIAVLHDLTHIGQCHWMPMCDYVIGVGSGDTQELSDCENRDLVSYFGIDDAHAIALARDTIAHFNWNAGVQMPLRDVHKPHYDSQDIAGLVPINHCVLYDAHELIARLCDGPSFILFKPHCGGSIVCVNAKILGHHVGIIANNGPIDCDGASKAAQFIKLSDQAGHALIFLTNLSEFICEQKSNHGAMVAAVINARVPKLSFCIGACFGGASAAMCGYGCEPDFLFSWPNARVGEMENPVSALVSSGLMLDHGVIDPRDTRPVIGFALDTLREAQNRDLKNKNRTG